MVLAGLPVTIQFIISGIRIFAGIIGSIASTPEKEQTHEVCFTKEYAKKALTLENENEKIEALSSVSNIIDDKPKIKNKILYIEDRQNLFHLEMTSVLEENKEQILNCLMNKDNNAKSSVITL